VASLLRAKEGPIPRPFREATHDETGSRVRLAIVERSFGFQFSRVDFLVEKLTAISQRRIDVSEWLLKVSMYSEMGRS
jgi:hypothetical protein